MHARSVSSPTESDPPHRRHRHRRVVPAHHLAKTVASTAARTPGAGLHYAAGYRRPMVPALLGPGGSDEQLAGPTLAIRHKYCASG
jgi:hypothetical protein